MSLSEIPSKVLEGFETFATAKLHVAAELTKLIHSHAGKKLSEEEVLQTYFECYQKLKGLTPPPLAPLPRSRWVQPLLWIGAGGLLVVLCGAYLALKFFKYI